MDEEKLEREAAKILFSTPSKPEEQIPSKEAHGPEILFVCPFCNETYPVSTELAGKKINCRNCREPCRVDSIKIKSKRRSVFSFWLGLGLGIVLTVLAVVALKLLRVL
jgi:hypothetical protein